MAVRTIGRIVGLIGVVAVVVRLSSACGPSSCDPEEFDLEDAKVLVARALPGETLEAGCFKPGVRVIASEVELQQLYQDVGLLVVADGGPSKLSSGDYPVVDFSHERVVVSEATAGEGIQWAVAQGDTAVVGLAGCRTSRASSLCTVTLGAVDALVTRVESRTCNNVLCGQVTPKRGR
jgi:hypothetical protein